MIALFALWSCKGPVDPPVEQALTCDAGHEAWVQRALPLMWGRRAHGAAEIRAWADQAASAGRPAVIRAMAADPEFSRWWRQWISDALAVARTGDKAYADCFGEPLRDTWDGSLAQTIRSADAPWETPADLPFNMADVILDGLAADDLAVIWQAHLFARMYRPVQGANVSELELEYNRRVNFGEVFFETYLNRNLDCVLCHNSSFSVTDADDAREDRTWQLPGRHEAALLGSDVSFDKQQAFAMFRFANVVRYDGGQRPWGMSEDCGRFFAPERVGGPDPLGWDESFFIDDYGTEGSVWQLERSLAEGVDRLAGNGLTVGDGGLVSGRESFAYLLGARIADEVFELATGGRLTVAHGFPRNLDQAARLESLTDTLVTSGFSLQELLIAIAEDPLFNPGLPEVCDTVAYGLPPVCNPWSTEEDDPDERRNSPGDRVHRHNARVLLNSVHHQLGWAPPPAWRLSEGDAEFQASLGVFLRESQPGFSGTDFQGLLAWTTRYGVCANPDGGPDWLDGLLARADGQTVEGLVLALEDRLLADGAIDELERPLLEALVGSLDAPASTVDPEGLRALCGAWVASPRWMLALDAPIGPVPPLAEDPAADCERARDLMLQTGTSAATCTSP